MWGLYSAFVSLLQVERQPQRYLGVHGRVEGAKVALEGEDDSTCISVNTWQATAKRQLTDIRHILFSEKFGTTTTSSFSARNSTSTGSIATVLYTTAFVVGNLGGGPHPRALICMHAASEQLNAPGLDYCKGVFPKK